jgi:hypothetical protein
LNELELFHGIDSLINVLSELLKGTFEQPLNQEGDILQGEYFIGVVAVVVFADVAQVGKALLTVTVHADVGVGGNFVGGFLGLVVFGADGELHYGFEKGRYFSRDCYFTSCVYIFYVSSVAKL